MKLFGRSRLGERWNLLVLLIALAFADRAVVADEPGWVKVEGLLRDRQGERPLGRMAVAVSSKDGTVKEAVCVTDAKGRFEFEFPKLAGSSPKLQTISETSSRVPKTRCW